MSISRSIRRPIKRSIMQSIIGHFPFNKVVKAVTRYFTTLNPIVTAHYEILKPITFLGDFEIKIKFASTNTVDGMTLLSGSVSSTNSILLDFSGGNIRAFAYAGTTLQTILFASATAILDGKLRVAGLRYTGTTAELVADGVVLDSATWALDGNQNIKHAGARLGDYNKFSGVLADVEFIDKSGAQHITELFRLDFEPFKKVEYSNLTTLGTQELVNTLFDDTVGWSAPRSNSVISAVGNKLKSTALSTGVFGNKAELTGLDVGQWYDLTFIITHNISSGNVRLRASDEDDLRGAIQKQYISNDEEVTLLFEAIASTMYVGNIVTGHNTGDYVELSLASVKEIQGQSITAVNVANVWKEEFEFIDPDWVNISPAPQKIPSILEAP